MPEIVPVAVFGIHALVFGYFYLARGRRLHNLLFFWGFVLLEIFHVHRGWDDFTGEDPGMSFLHVLHGPGLLLCALGTVAFIRHLRQKRGAKASDGSTSR